MNAQFQQITDRIVAAIERGCDDYAMPWHRLGACQQQPVNATTGKSYRGVNVLSLWLAAAMEGFSTGRWASYRQWAASGAQVRKGQKGTPVCFWQSRRLTNPGDDEDAQRAPFVARTFFVFNADQVEGAPELPTSLELGTCEKTERAIKVLEATKARVIHGGDIACFEPATDLIRLPAVSQFREQAGYVSVRAHETVHWTGAKNRLDRNLKGRFGSDAYAMEELVAELGAAFLCGALGISVEPRADHAAYICSWLKVLRGDDRAILTAASRAQAAADFILDGDTRPSIGAGRESGGGTLGEIPPDTCAGARPSRRYRNPDNNGAVT